MDWRLRQNGTAGHRPGSLENPSYRAGTVPGAPNVGVTGLAVEPPRIKLRFAKHAIAANLAFVNFFVQRSDLRDLYDKVAAGERISEADALRLFESKDLNAVGAIADLARQKKVGNRASYIINRYINYSNYCILSCQFCSFARKKRDADGFELTTAQIVEKAREALKLGITELHIVGGLHPSLPFNYYLNMLRELKAVDPKLQLKCFTA